MDDRLKERHKMTDKTRILLILLSGCAIIFGSLYGQSRIRLNIQSNSMIHFVVKDEIGRQTGRDPRGHPRPWQGKPLREIPGAQYAINTVGDSPSEYEPSADDVQHEFEWSFELENSTKELSLEAIGVRAGLYWIHFSVDPVGGKGKSLSLQGIIDTAQSCEFSVLLATTAGIGLTVTKSMYQGSLRQDVDNCYKLSLLGEKQLYKDLSHRLDKFEKYLEKEDSIKARHELEKFGEKLDEVYGKDRKKASRDEESKRREYQEEEKGKDRGKKMDESKAKRRKHFITADAYTILKEDVSLLLDQLPGNEKKRPKKEKERD